MFFNLLLTTTLIIPDFRAKISGHQSYQFLSDKFNLYLVSLFEGSSDIQTISSIIHSGLSYINDMLSLNASQYREYLYCDAFKEYRDCGRSVN